MALIGPDELIVQIEGVTADGTRALLVSLVPAAVHLESLALRREDGGLAYRDGNSKNWETCRSQLVDPSELNLPSTRRERYLR
jgi:hypothetical protein